MQDVQPQPSTIWRWWLPRAVETCARRPTQPSTIWRWWLPRAVEICARRPTQPSTIWRWWLPRAVETCARRPTTTIHHLAMVATKSGGDLCKTSNHNHPPSGDGGYQERTPSLPVATISSRSHRGHAVETCARRPTQPSTIWRWWLRGKVEFILSDRSFTFSSAREWRSVRWPRDLLRSARTWSSVRGSTWRSAGLP